MSTISEIRDTSSILHKQDSHDEEISRKAGERQSISRVNILLSIQEKSLNELFVGSMRMNLCCETGAAEDLQYSPIGERERRDKSPRCFHCSPAVCAQGHIQYNHLALWDLSIFISYRCFRSVT